MTVEARGCSLELRVRFAHALFLRQETARELVERATRRVIHLSWRTMKKLLLGLCLAAAGCGGGGGANLKVPLPPEGASAKKPHAVLETTKGRIVLRLLPEASPKAVSNFTSFAQKSFYNGTVFHRVIADFMIQGGSPKGEGPGLPGHEFLDEFSPTHPLDKAGVVAMANHGPNTNGSQFFITVVPTPWLTNKHTVFAEVAEGYEVVEAISKVPVDKNHKPVEPVVLKEVRIEQR